MNRNYWKQSVQIPPDHDVISEDQVYDRLSTFQENHEDYNIGSCPAYDTITVSAQSPF